MHLVEERLEIPAPAGVAEARLYRPGSPGPLPGALVLTDIGGIRPSQIEIARRIAAAGYLVLQPNVFYRTSRLPVFPFEMKRGEERTTNRFRELGAPLTAQAMEQDGAAFVDDLEGLPGLAPGGVRIAGFCFTGSMALRTAAARPDRVVAAVSLHGGRLATDAPDSPHTVLPRVKARLYFGHAVEDASMPREAIERLESALKAWGGEYRSETYEGAYHSWTIGDSPVYNQLQADRAFHRLLECFGGA